jgi:hypothetical protein
MNASKSMSVRISVVVFAVLMALMLSLILSSQGAATAVAVAPDPDLQRSFSLATGPDVSSLDVSDYYATSGAASDEARRLAESVPLPEGGNFNGIRWDELGGVSRAGIKGLLLFNAACQWARAQDDGREPTKARLILDEVPRWPTLRQGDRNAFARALVLTEGQLAAGVRRDCRELHEREVTYAKQRGTLPSS